MSCVPLPWCTSQSTIATRSTPSSACAQRAAIAIESKRQKPIARSCSAWWPGGRARASPPSRTASIAAPAASSAASKVVSVQIVSASIEPRVVRTSSRSRGVWQRRTSSSVADPHSTNEKRSCRTSMRRCDSGCPPVGWSRAKRFVADDVDELDPQARAVSLVASAFSPSSRACSAARSQSGGVAASGGSGALASIVAMLW